VHSLVGAGGLASFQEKWTASGPGVLSSVAAAGWLSYERQGCDVGLCRLATWLSHHLSEGRLLPCAACTSF
jgi:hypothetical protein